MGNIGRRGFLGALAASVAATAAALELDPERALWLPGKKTIFLPPKDVRIASPAETKLYEDEDHGIPPRFDHRFRMDVTSRGRGGHTSLYFDDRWALVKAVRHTNGKGEKRWERHAENIKLTPAGLHIIEAELGQKLSDFRRVGVEHTHGLNHHELDHVAGRVRFTPRNPALTLPRCDVPLGRS